MRQHIDILGWLYVAAGALGVLTAVFIFLVLGVTGGVAGGLARDALPAVLLTGIGFFAAVLVAVFSVPNLLVGWGLLQRKSWSRIVGLVLGCMGDCSASPSAPRSASTRSGCCSTRSRSGFSLVDARRPRLRATQSQS